MLEYYCTNLKLYIVCRSNLRVNWPQTQLENALKYWPELRLTLNFQCLSPFASCISFNVFQYQDHVLTPRPISTFARKRNVTEYTVLTIPVIRRSFAPKHAGCAEKEAQMRCNLWNGGFRIFSIWIISRLDEFIMISIYYCKTDGLLQSIIEI